jgi:hypothetical protein
VRRAVAAGVGVAGAIAAGAGCRAPCNLDIDQPLCVDRFEAVDLLVHAVDPDVPLQDATDAPIAQARGDVLLGAEWALAAKDGGVVVGFPEVAAAGLLPAFTAEGACSVATRRSLVYLPDITVQRQPRLQVQVGGCATRAQVLFTGPADFGRAVLPWPREEGGSDLWIAAPAEGLARGAIYGFVDGADRAPGLRNHDEADVLLEGESPGDRLGTVLARCPDPGGGDEPLLAVGLPGWSGLPDEDPVAQRGAIAFFRASEAVDRVWTVAGAAALLEGDAAGDRAGLAVACDADLDGDGVPEIVVGAPGVDAGLEESGAVYVLSGALPARATLGDAAAIVWIGREPDEQLGASLALADLDGDGLGDIVAGAPGLGPRGSPGAGGVRVARGSEIADGSFTATTLLGRSSGIPDLLGRLGTTLTVGDLTGDGRPDVAAGAWRLPADGRFHAGEVRIWSFADDGAGDTLAAEEALVIAGDGSHQQLGRRTLAADVTADGLPDLVSVTRRRAR